MNTETSSPAPTAKQLNYLRNLASRTGQTFTNPAARRQASVEIQRLQAVRTTGFTFAEIRAKQAAREAHHDVPLNLASAVHPSEITGYGSTATRSQRS